MENKITNYLKEFFYLIIVPLGTSFILGNITFRLLLRNHTLEGDELGPLMLSFLLFCFCYIILTISLIFYRQYKNKSVSTKTIILIATLPIIILITLYTIGTIRTSIFQYQMTQREKETTKSLNLKDCMYKRIKEDKGAIICNISSTKKQSFIVEYLGYVNIKGRESPSPLGEQNCNTKINSMNINNNPDKKEKFSLIDLKEGQNTLQMNFKIPYECFNYSFDYPIEYGNLIFNIYKPESMLFQGRITAIDKIAINEVK